MDTDELSEEAYDAVIVESGKFNDDLTLQFGLIANSCKNEKEYLAKAKRLITTISEMDEDHLYDLFFGSPPNKKNLFLILEKIQDKISAVEKIPESKRHYEF